MTFTKTAVLVSLVVVTLSGCAVFRGNELAELGTLPGPDGVAKKPTAGYDFASTANTGERKAQHERLRTVQENEFVAVLRESGYFATIEKGNGKDVNISIELVETGNPAALVPAVVTGLSLYTIPSWAKVDLEAICKVTTADGKTREYKLKDSATLVQWLPMMAVFPFKPFSEIESLRKNIYRNLIVKMQQDGLLPQARPLQKTSSNSISFESPANSAN